MGHRRIATLAGLAAILTTLALAPTASASDGRFDRAWGWNVNGGGAFEICTVAASCMAGTAGGQSGEFNTPGDVAVDAARNAVYVADNVNNRIQKFDLSGNFVAAWGKDVDATNPGGTYEICEPPGPCQAGQAGGGDGEMNSPVGVATDAAGDVYVADTGNNRIQQFNSLGDPQLAFGKDVAVGANPGFEICGPVTSVDCQPGQTGGLGGEMNFPYGVAFDASGNIYVADFGNQRIQRYDQFATWQRTWGKGVDATSAGNGFEICTAASGHTCQPGGQGGLGGELSFPSGLDIGPAGIVYVADSGNNRVQGFDLLGNWQIAWGRDVNATDPSSVFELCTAASGDTCQAGAVGSQAGEMSNPSGIATDGTEAVYVADTNNHRIQKFSFTGIVTWGSAGTAGGEFSLPFGIGSDADGTVYVGDTANNRVQMFGANAGPLPPPADVTPIPAPVVGATPPFTAPTGLRAAARQKCKRKHRTRAGGDKSKHHKKLRKCRRKANRLPV